MITKTQPTRLFTPSFAVVGQRPFLPLLLILLCLLFLIGCRRDDTPAESEAESATQISLICSEACASHGQCGEAADGRRFILGHPDRPAVRDHQMIFAEETAVLFINTREEKVRVLTTGEEFDHTFFLVTRPDDRRSGWVPRWCVQ